MAAATTDDVAKTSLKLMVHKGENRVIFAEADSVFVDALYSIMTLPMGTILRLLEKCPDEKLKTLGSLKNLYQSLVDLPENYLSAEESKVLTLNPRSSAYELCRKLKLNIDDTEPIKYYICSKWDSHPYEGVVHFSTCNLARCGKCGKLMNKEIVEKNSTTNTAVGDGQDCVFVSDVSTFIVTDDLQVFPNTAAFGINFLRNLGITDGNLLEELTFDIGLEQILILLKGALSSKCSLTYMVFNHTCHDRNSLKPRPETLIQYLTSDEIVATSEKVMLKIHLQKSTSKFLFAEANEDFVDLLLGFLEIPLGTMIGKLMSSNISSVGSLDNLYKSISNMDVGHIKSQDLKDVLLKPLLAWHYVSRNKIFSLDVSNVPYVYCHWDGIYDANSGTIRPLNAYLRHVEFKGSLRCDPMSFKDPRLEGSMFKAPAAKFMLTDDLVLTPSSSISTISMLSKLNVSLDDVKEREVSIGMEEGLKIFKASLKSVTVLSDALLEGDAI